MKTKRDCTVYNINDLIETLKEFPKEFYVIIAGDSEGNQYSPMHSIQTVNYNLDSEAYNYTSETILEEGDPNAIVIYPEH